MDQRIFPTSENKATLICPKCGRTKTADVSKFAGTRKTVKIKSTCSCGHSWTSVLEKRKKYRKQVNLAGTFDHSREGKIVDRGGMRVVDLSFDGVKLKLNSERNLRPGDHLLIEFHLDDGKNTLIRREVTVRNVKGVFIGATFRSTEAYSPALGFYLMVEKRSGNDRRLMSDRRNGDDDSYSGMEKRDGESRRSGEDRRQNDDEGDCSA